MNWKTFNILCVLCAFVVIEGASAYANRGTGTGGPYYYRDNQLSAGVTGGTSDDFGYNWVEIIGQGGIQINGDATFVSSGYYSLDCNANTAIPSERRGVAMMNYYLQNPAAPNYSYQFRIFRCGYIVDYTANATTTLTPANADFTSTFDYGFHPWWDDLVIGPDSWVGFRMDGIKPYRRLIITYYHMYHTMLPYVEGEEAERSITFQVIIYEPPMGMTTYAHGNDIVFNYQDAKFEYWDSGNKVEVTSISRGASATIGIERDASNYIKYSFNTVSVNNNSSILFTRTDYLAVNVRMPSAPVSLVSAGTPIKRGTHQAFERFSLQASSGTAQWVNIKIDKRGTALDADVTSVDVYKDTNGDGQWNAGDSLLGSGVFVNGTTVVPANDAVSTTERYYFIVMRIKENVTGGKTLGVRVRYRTYLQFVSSGSVPVLWDSNF